ncbi:MAG: isochorismatase family protein [Chloroflexi bacterium]|nr:isochorismatase family protein [Chloroflexota bacterium]MCI0836992.1 isochorismatase family protein [Chloroflexota bacterium]
MELSLTDALIVIDIQNDFCEGGTVPVEGALALVKSLTTLSRRVQSVGGRVIATQDWHTEKHLSFVENGGKWPLHCVQGTEGANFHPNLKLPVGSIVIRKGADPKIDAQSAFAESTFEETLRRHSVERLFICGVPAELTVLKTALDARSLGFETLVVEDGIAALTRDAAEVARAIEKMKTAGIEFVTSTELAT